MNKIDSMAAPGVSPLVVGDYRWPLSPREYVERNVRISPIPAPHESPLTLMEQVPGVAVFSSDYPHYEGNPDPLAFYDGELSLLDEATTRASSSAVPSPMPTPAWATPSDSKGTN